MDKKAFDVRGILAGRAPKDAAVTVKGWVRTLACVTGLANVRDAIPFPRTPGNAR